MSIERELLEKIISKDDAGDFFIGYRLYKDIETFLAQPEQESVAWYWEDSDLDDPEWIAMADTGDKPIEHRLRRNIQPLYLAPPKREPLSEEEMSKAFMQDDYGKWDIKSFVNGIRFAEKAHGIGGGE